MGGPVGNHNRQLPLLRGRRELRTGQHDLLDLSCCRCESVGALLLAWRAPACWLISAAVTSLAKCLEHYVVSIHINPHLISGRRIFKRRM